MSILEKIKNKKDVYIYMREKAKMKKAEVIKIYEKSSTGRATWNYWNGVEMNCNMVISDLTEIERECEMAFNSIKIDLSALRGE